MYALVLFISFHFEGGVSSEVVKFDDLEKCETARKAIVKGYNETNVSSHRRPSIIAECVKL